VFLSRYCIIHVQEVGYIYICTLIHLILYSLRSRAVIIPQALWQKTKEKNMIDLRIDCARTQSDSELLLSGGGSGK